ncbi:MAG: NfeD family protein [Thermoguttaceae bacterium]|jgi:membrane-bound serine protease (ClpP class)|nr:NfeD family protein [Thermoguttaceae bacterium]
MIEPWLWAIVLIILGIGLAVLELFVPSGGVLGFLSLASIAAGMVAGFMAGPVIGLVILIAVMIVLPGGLALAVKWWPQTPIGRRILLRVARGDDVLPDNPYRRSLREMVGKVGVAKSKMLPSGAILIDGRTVDAYSEGVPIDPGQRVVVLAVQGTRVLVRPVDEEEQAATEGGDGELSTPIDAIGPDPFPDTTA